MKKILLIAIVCLLAHTGYAQTGKIGVNTTAPKATLDIQSKSDNTTADVEGLLVPRISKEKAYKMATATTKPDTSNMVYINELTATTASTDTTVTDITEKGYYFWNGGKWVKTVGKDGAEWVYEGDSIRLKRSGVGTFKNKVYYAKDGGYRSISAPNIEADTTAYNVQTFAYSSDTIRSSMNRNEYVIDRDATSTHAAFSDDAYLSAQYNKAVVTEQVTTSPHATFACRNVAEKNSAADAWYTIGTESYAYVNNGNTEGYASGITTGVNARSSGYINNVYGVNSQPTISQGQTGDVQAVIGVSSQLGFLGSVSTNVQQSIGFYARQYLRDPKSKPHIGTAVGFSYGGFTHLEPDSLLDKHYGVYLSNITKATPGNNYAIYTNKGKVYFQDSVGIGTTTPIAKLDVRGNINNADTLGLSVFRTGPAENTMRLSHFINNDTTTHFSPIGNFVRLNPKNIETEAPFVNFAHQARNEGYPRRTGYIQSGIVTDSTGAAVRGSMLIQSEFGPPDVAIWTSDINVESSELILNPQGGNVGVGTATPAQKLHVSGVMRLEPQATAPTGALGDLYVGTDNKIYFHNGTEWKELQFVATQ